MRVLIVEDERKLAQALASALKGEHYEVVVASTGEDGFFRANAERFELVVLDVMLPGRSGLEILGALRQRHIDTPVLILTARDGVNDRVLGLDLGADDYLVKPFAPEELVARAKALLRRSQEEQHEVLRYADVELDTGTRIAHRSAREIELSPTEYELLLLFMKRPRQVLTREIILDRVWGMDFEGSSNVIEVYVGYLRAKLEAEGEPRLIHTVRGVGYVFKE